MVTIERILDCEACFGNVEAVIFDLDDTLYSEKAYVRSGYRAVAEAFPQIEDMKEKLWRAFEEGLPAIDTVLKNEGLWSEETKAKALECYRLQEPQIALYQGVEEMLKRLKQTKRLGLITDGRPEGQRAKIKSLGLIAYFDRIIITDELGGIGFRKPNPLAFRQMQEALGTSFEKMIYVGDNLNKDFIAPTALGMQCCYFKNADGLYYRP